MSDAYFERKNQCSMWFIQCDIQSHPDQKTSLLLNNLYCFVQKKLQDLLKNKNTAWKLNDFSVSNDTVSRCVNEMSQNIVARAVNEIK